MPALIYYIFRVILETWSIVTMHLGAVVELLKILGISTAWIGSLIFWVVRREKVSARNVM
jgi:hypothetical protein